MSDFDAQVAGLGGFGIELRNAGDDDADLIKRIIAMTTSWRDEHVPYELPENVAKYHEGWGRPGDIGVLAFSGLEFAGGAFVRRFGVADGAYGYVADEYPELAIAVEAGFRRRGIGVILLAALKAKVLEAGAAGISLSVEPDNGSRHLYARMGFAVVEERPNDWVMLWTR